jgi:hypothetical protein
MRTKQHEHCERLKQAVDALHMCANERFRASGDIVLMGYDETFLTGVPMTEAEAGRVAEALDLVIAPLRARRMADLLDEMRAMIDEMQWEAP